MTLKKKRLKIHRKNNDKNLAKKSMKNPMQIDSPLHFSLTKSH